MGLGEKKGKSHDKNRERQNEGEGRRRMRNKERGMRNMKCVGEERARKP
jgi:hypothetical protein